MRSTLVDPGSSPTTDLRAWYEVQHAARVRDRPRHPMPSQRHLTELLKPDPGLIRTSRLFRDGYGTPIATTLLDLWADPQLAHLASVDVVVRPHFRRRGIGRALVHGLAVSAAGLGRETLITRAVHDSDGASFCAAAGFRPVLERVEAVLDLRPASLAAIDARTLRVPGYRLEAWSGTCPDRLVQGYASTLGALGDQPLGALDVRRSFAVSVEAIRAFEAAMQARHQHRLVVAACCARTGNLVGVTCVDVHRDSAQAGQGPTAVAAAHRGRGLALWLKSDLVCRLIETEPQVRWITTTNAVENRQIRRVNETLGFRVMAAVAEFQRTLAAEHR